MSQLPLPLTLSEHSSFATFVAAGHGPAVAHVRAVATGERATLWLFGPRGVGKTHLLQAACREAAAAGRRAMYVSLPAVSPAILAELEPLDLLALDDVDAVAKAAEWERALFVIINEFASGRGGLLLSASAAASACDFALADLRSRAAGAVAYRLHALGDEDLVVALRVHAKSRGLELEPAAADYLLRRVARDMPALTEWLDRLDRDSLVEQRRLSIPFIRDRLAAHGG